MHCRPCQFKLNEVRTPQKHVRPAIPVLVILAALSLLFSACSDDPYTEGPSGPDISDATPPVFSVTLVDIPTAAEDALSTTDPEFMIIGFGENLEGDPTKPARLSPALEYYTWDAAAEVRAPCDLYLEKIMDNEVGVGDFELELRTSSSSAYFIYIDHVRDLRFAEGAFIAQDQVIGLSGVSPAYRSELQVNFLELTDDHRFHTIHYCPLDFGTEDFIKSHTDFAPMEEWKLIDAIDGGYYG